MATTRRIQTIADQVYSILRKNICEGQYPPGSWLQEVELCNQLGVSRSPVREALHRLVSDGLVVSVPNRGTFVKEFTCRDIDEIFDMRVMLEEYAIRRSRRNMTSQHIETLLDILRQLEYFYAAGDVEEYDRVGIMNQQFRVLSLSVRSRFEESLGEHRQIIHALIEGNTAMAEQCNRRHLELARECIKEQLARKAKPGAD